jgi:ketosteroid isomerase-like protein
MKWSSWLIAAASLATACSARAPAGQQSPMLEHSTAGTPADRDRLAVSDAVLAIVRGADLRQWDAVRAAFAERVELDYGTPEQLTPQQIVDRWAPLFAELDATEHRVRDLAVALNGDRASATSRFRAEHVMRGAAGGETWVLEGSYEHDLARTPAGWKVTRMRMIPGQSSGNTGMVAEAQARMASRPRAATDAADASEANVDALRARNRAIVRAFFHQLETMDTGERFAALFADDARQVMPFAPEGFPRLLDGRRAILQQYGGLPQSFEYMRFPSLIIRDMASPEEFFATYRGDIKLKAGGKYDNEYAAHFVVRGGRIAEIREFFDPIVLQKAFGGQLQRTFNVRP